MSWLAIPSRDWKNLEGRADSGWPIRAPAMIATVKRGLLLVTACAQPWFEGMAATPREDPGAADFFVSSRGKDTWSGKLGNPRNSDGPFATMARAREAVRALLRTQKEPRPV